MEPEGSLPSLQELSTCTNYIITIAQRTVILKSQLQRKVMIIEGNILMTHFLRNIRE
jgi:hypothetical protein